MKFAFVWLLTACPAFAAQWKPGLAVGSAQYANESQGTSRIDVDLDVRSESRVNQARRFELGFKSFFESKPAGDQSMDIDRLVYRVPTFGGGHLWVGRAHPAEEGRYERLTHRNAIGANWVQNQSNALSPRVNGWIGFGWYQSVNERIHLTVSASPIFLPTFGPRLDLSNKGPSSGSRYARLPPSYVRLGNGLAPLRYEVSIDDLKEILFQPQGYVELGYGTRRNSLSLMAWSAPSPDPEVGTEGLLRVNETNGVDVLVTAKPSFPRENFLGVRGQLRSIIAEPEFQFTYETNSRRFTLSAGFSLSDFVQAGFLHEILPPSPPSSGPSIETPRYREYLVWSTVHFAPHSRLRPSVTFERHFKPQREGFLLNPTLEYQLSQQLALFSSAAILTGTNFSYFGGWRELDSLSLGGRYQW